MIRNTLLASAIGITLAGAAFAQGASPSANTQTGPRVTGSGENSSVTYPPGQGPAVVGGGERTAPAVSGSGNNMSTERTDQGRGNSPSVSGGTAPRSGGAGQGGTNAEVTGSGNNLSTEGPRTTPGNSPTGR